MLIFCIALTFWSNSGQFPKTLKKGGLHEYLCNQYPLNDTVDKLFATIWTLSVRTRCSMLFCYFFFSFKWIYMSLFCHWYYSSFDRWHYGTFSRRQHFESSWIFLLFHRSHFEETINHNQLLMIMFMLFTCTVLINRIFDTSIARITHFPSQFVYLVLFTWFDFFGWNKWRLCHYYDISVYLYPESRSHF